MKLRQLDCLVATFKLVLSYTFPNTRSGEGSKRYTIQQRTNPCLCIARILGLVSRSTANNLTEIVRRKRDRRVDEKLWYAESSLGKLLLKHTHYIRTNSSNTCELARVPTSILRNKSIIYEIDGSINTHLEVDRK